MSTVDALLAQSLLLAQPHVPCDVVSHDYLDYAGLAKDFLLQDRDGPGHGDDRAAQNLTALCEAAVAHCTLEQLADFLTEHVPQPRAAWILGCALQLAGADDGARFWWQYAAGADDAPASYCLYLQHLACGDTQAAAWWQAQAAQDTDAAEAGDETPALAMMAADTSITTLLRVLSRLSLTMPRRHTLAAQAVIEFVAAAVAAGYNHHPDLELPMPGADFAEQLIIVAAAFAHKPPSSNDDVPAEELPNRRRLDGSTRHLPGRGRAQGPERLLVEVTAGNNEGATARVFFKEAVAVCWEKATVATGAEVRGTPMAYYLKRFRTRTALTRSPAPLHT
ncbi:hypothetical protein [Streptomyces sp. NPDC017940]|uniref:hypothetical protein n=1 Tax=Streptomyces sp. NPDC017940 TaxID=3365017 RepID=UPI0037B054DF